MRKAQQIINIIEGFKLGSLGVGSKKPILTVSEPEPKPQVQDTVSEPVNKQSTILTKPIPLPRVVVMKAWKWLTAVPDFKDGTGAFDAVSWTEDCSGYKTKLLLMCNRIGDKYSLDLYAGSKLRISYARDRPIGKGYDFNLRGGNFSFPTGEGAAQKFRKVVSEIKIAGSFAHALISGNLGSDWLARLNSDKNGLQFYVRVYTGYDTKDPSFTYVH